MYPGRHRGEAQGHVVEYVAAMAKDYEPQGGDRRLPPGVYDRERTAPGSHEGLIWYIMGVRTDINGRKCFRDPLPAVVRSGGHVFTTFWRCSLSSRRWWQSRGKRRSFSVQLNPEVAKTRRWWRRYSSRTRSLARADLTWFEAEYAAISTIENLFIPWLATEYPTWSWRAKTQRLCSCRSPSTSRSSFLSSSEDDYRRRRGEATVPTANESIFECGYTRAERQE